MEYRCAVCGTRVSGDMIIYMDHTEKHIIDLVKHDHPDWVEKNGVCQKCFEYYKAELKGAPFGDAPCALRMRTVRNFLQIISHAFKGGKK